MCIRDSLAIDPAHYLGGSRADPVDVPGRDLHSKPQYHVRRAGASALAAALVLDLDLAGDLPQLGLELALCRALRRDQSAPEVVEADELGDHRPLARLGEPAVGLGQPE